MAAAPAEPDHQYDQKDEADADGGQNAGAGQAAIGEERVEHKACLRGATAAAKRLPMASCLFLERNRAGGNPSAGVPLVPDPLKPTGEPVRNWGKSGRAPNPPLPLSACSGTKGNQ
ncbi:hypothetical protein GCM10028812_29120 [Ancylobacter sonchi]